MAKLKGLIKFQGKLDNFVAYEMNGQIIIRRKTSVNKKRIETDPAFKRTRELNKEFGGAAMLSKYIRRKWMPISLKDKDGTLNNRLTSMFLNAIHGGQGTKGQRTFDWNELNNDLQGFRINGNQNQSLLLNVMPKVMRTDSTLVLTLDEQHWSNIPKGATHLQLQIHVFALGTLVFDQNANGYKIQDDSNEYQRLETILSPKVDPISAQFTLLLSSQNRPYLVCYSIYVSQEMNGTHYSLQSHPFFVGNIV